MFDFYVVNFFESVTTGYTTTYKRKAIYNKIMSKNKIKISTHSPFQPLKAVLLGQGVSENFFDWINDPKIKDPLLKIVRETNEDLAFMRKILEQHGVKVFQTTPLEYKEDNFRNKIAIPVPPLQPRDVHLTLGTNCYCTSTQPEWSYIKDIVDESCLVNLFDLAYHNGAEFKGGDLLSGANTYRLGTKLIVGGVIDKNMEKFACDFFESQGYEIIFTGDAGHTDGCMSVLKPGVIVSLKNFLSYEKTFPSWAVLHCENQSWNKINGWLKFKTKSNGRWWIPGEESNEYLKEFVDTWLNKWVGYVEETVFDVNMLSISEEVVLVNNYNREVFDFLKKHSIEPIVCPLRHRYFWDGGIHCLTLDLVREGNRENYF